MGKDKAKSAWSAHERSWRLAKTGRELIGVTALAGAMALLPTSVRSQERFPTRNVRIIVPFPAGVTAPARAMALLPPSVRSQERLSTRNVRIIVPFPAGATTDMLARLFAQRMSEGLGQSVVVENVGGAGGSLGADQVAKAAPDDALVPQHDLHDDHVVAAIRRTLTSRYRAGLRAD